MDLLNLETQTTELPRDGVIYVATGEEHAREAIRSAESLRRHMPTLPIILYTDIPDIDHPAIQSVIRIKSLSHSYTDKIGPLADLPFERTLFLDSDTYVVAPVDDLFVLLDRFDVAAAHDPWRIGPDVNAPSSFPELNTGVLLVRRCQAVHDMISSWLNLHTDRVSREPTIGDQASFREAVFQSAVSLYVLPSEFNFRTFCPNFAGQAGRIRILHGSQNLAMKLEPILNRKLIFRVFVPSISNLRPDSVITSTTSARRLVWSIAAVSNGVRIMARVLRTRSVTK